MNFKFKNNFPSIVNQMKSYHVFPNTLYVTVYTVSTMILRYKMQGAPPSHTPAYIAPVSIRKFLIYLEFIRQNVAVIAKGPLNLTCVQNFIKITQLDQFLKYLQFNPP